MPRLAPHLPTTSDNAPPPPRKCWVCKEIMTVHYNTYHCDPCDLQERLVYSRNELFYSTHMVWVCNSHNTDHRVTFIDHSKEHVPHP